MKKIQGRTRKCANDSDNVSMGDSYTNMERESGVGGVVTEKDVGTKMFSRSKNEERKRIDSKTINEADGPQKQM